ncbi:MULTISPECIES: hypothetical protein [unclassified Streptomyces]
MLYAVEQVADIWRPYADILRAETVTRPVIDADGDNHAAVDGLVRAMLR